MILCPKLKQIKSKNQHNQQEMKNVIYSDIEFYMEGVSKMNGENTYKISNHIPFAVGVNFNTIYESYFGS